MVMWHGNINAFNLMYCGFQGKKENIKMILYKVSQDCNEIRMGEEYM